MKLTGEQKRQKKLLQMAYDNLDLLTESKNWDDSFDKADVKYIREAMGKIACILYGYFPDWHEEFIADAIDKMEFGSSIDEREEKIIKAIRHNMNKIVGDADLLIETGGFLDW